uniref:Uncharacterized protein n=1 Tax=Ciona intestinalis TaxID=7719 RepID=H2XQN7_CIOIN
MREEHYYSRIFTAKKAAPFENVNLVKLISMFGYYKFIYICSIQYLPIDVQTLPVSCII